VLPTVKLPVKAVIAGAKVISLTAFGAFNLFSVELVKFIEIFLKVKRFLVSLQEKIGAIALGNI